MCFSIDELLPESLEIIRSHEATRNTMKTTMQINDIELKGTVFEEGTEVRSQSVRLSHEPVYIVILFTPIIVVYESIFLTLILMQHIHVYISFFFILSYILFCHIPGSISIQYLRRSSQSSFSHVFFFAVGKVGKAPFVLMPTDLKQDTIFGIILAHGRLTSQQLQMS